MFTIKSRALFQAAAAFALGAPFVPAQAATILNYQGPGAAIVDFQNNTSTITVTDSFAVADVNVIFDRLTHSLPREVQLYLEKGDISVALILNKDVGRNNFGANFTFDDEAAQPISAWTGGTNTTGFRPVQPLSAFDGLTAAGAWRIRTFDTAGGDAGGFQGWTLQLTDATPVASVPEPAAWALMIGGFGLVGGALRRRARTRILFA